jgi:predicted nucleic acid-binding protein
MRLHITLEDELVTELDRRVGARQRSGYIAAVLRRALGDEHRWELVESAIGAIGSGAARHHRPHRHPPRSPRHGRGNTLTQADCLIAASARALGARLATGNPLDFPMADLAVEH